MGGVLDPLKKKKREKAERDLSCAKDSRQLMIRGRGWRYEKRKGKWRQVLCYQEPDDLRSVKKTILLQKGGYLDGEPALKREISRTGLSI